MLLNKITQPYELLASCSVMFSDLYKQTLTNELDTHRVSNTSFEPRAKAKLRLVNNYFKYKLKLNLTNGLTVFPQYAYSKV